MLNYKKILSIADLSTISNLFESVAPCELPIRINEINSFLNEGKQSAANVNDERVRKWDITMHTDLIHTIYLMAVSMNESQEDLGVWIKVPDGKLISIAPLLDLFETLNKAEFQDMVDNLEEIRQVLSNYLNESNVWEYKKCTETVGYLHEMMERLNHIVQKR